MDGAVNSIGSVLRGPAAVVFLLLLGGGRSLWSQVEPAEPPRPPAPEIADTPVLETPRVLAERRTAPLFDLRALRFGVPSQTRQRTLLAEAPNMFGDSFAPAISLSFSSALIPVPATTDIPLAAGCRRVKIAENNKPLPQDRVYLLYNHFHNALIFDRLGAVAPRDFSVDQYTLGFEKTLFGKLWSVGLRMPFADEMSAASPDLSVAGGRVGNLAILLKRQVFQTDTAAAAIGLGIDLPTGSDVTGLTPATAYLLDNQAVHLLPYVGLIGTPDEIWFWEGFAQIDVPTNGHAIELSALGPGTLGMFNEQSLMYLDLSLGCWLYRNPCARWMTGLASVVELHYTTTLQASDSVVGVIPGGTLAIQNAANRQDVLNLTFGLHTEFARRTLLRVAGVVPVTSGDDRFFDSEIQVQLERRF